MNDRKDEARFLVGTRAAGGPDNDESAGVTSCRHKHYSLSPPISQSFHHKPAKTLADLLHHARARAARCDELARRYAALAQRHRAVVLALQTSGAREGGHDE